MWIVSALISICRRAHVFCLIYSMLLNLQQYRGSFYNRCFKYTFIRYSYKFSDILMCLLLHIFPCPGFNVVIFIKTLKNCTGTILNVSIISLHLLISYSFLTQLWIYSRGISLSGDIKLNPGPKRVLINVYQCVTRIWTSLHHIIFPKLSL